MHEYFETWLAVQIVDNLLWCVIAVPAFVLVMYWQWQEAREEKRQWNEALQEFWEPKDKRK